MYDAIRTWYVHTHSSVLNRYFLCTYYMQQHCCNVVVVSSYIRRVYIYVDTYHTCVSDLLSFFFVSYKSRIGSG